MFFCLNHSRTYRYFQQKFAQQHRKPIPKITATPTHSPTLSPQQLNEGKQKVTLWQFSLKQFQFYYALFSLIQPHTDNCGMQPPSSAFKLLFSQFFFPYFAHIPRKAYFCTCGLSPRVLNYGKKNTIQSCLPRHVSVKR